MKQLLSEEDFHLYEDSFQQNAVRAFRVNTEKISVEDFSSIDPFSSEPVPYVETGFYLNYDKVGNHPFHHAGMIYVQDPGAMATAECLEIQPDWWILDLCAAPGGKSTQLAAKLRGQGILVSNEIHPQRARILSRNLERCAVANALVLNEHPARLAERFSGWFDRIMVDAP